MKVTFFASVAALGLLTSQAYTQTPEPPMPGTPPTGDIFEIATERLPVETIPNIFARPLDSGTFEIETDPDAIQITEYEVLALPNGFSPDGIAVSKEGTIYAASIVSGQIVKGNVNGVGITEFLVDTEINGGAWGMDLTKNGKYLWVAGGLGGTVRSYDSNTGELVADVILSNFGIINDLIVTEDAVYITNSGFPLIYKIPLNTEGEQSGAASVIKLSSSINSDEALDVSFNGIAYDANSTRLIANDPSKGTYYSIDPGTGETILIDSQGVFNSNDGLAIDVDYLFGVDSGKNQVTIFELADNLSRAERNRVITTDIFDVPTLIALDDTYMYVVNGKLTTEGGPDVPYEIVRIPR